MNYKEIKEIIDDFGNSKIGELSIEFSDGTKVSMKKNSMPAVPELAKPVVVPEQAVTVVQKQAEEKKEEEYKVVKSPMVGTFYSKSSPNVKPYVEVGSKVKKGDILCIVEAMKLMNEIESEFDGEVAEVCAKDGEMVDYGKPLFKLK